TCLDASGRVRASGMLDAAQAGFGIVLDSAASRLTGDRGPGEFLWMGIEHIATGYDHLAFLLGLLIVASTMRAVARLITSFTVAHSITLALATLDVIRLPALVVEPLIALSIVYVGVENLRGGDREGRWRLTFLFGLIHGCGFASALRDAGVGSAGPGVAMPLICFNLGVELGQLALAALVLP